MESAVETTPCDCEEVDVVDDVAAVAAADDSSFCCSSSRPFCFFSNTNNSTAVNPESDCTMQAFSPSIEVRASRARQPLPKAATTDEDDDVALASFPPAPPALSPLVAVVAETTLSCSAEAAAVMRFRFVELLVGQ